MALILSIRDIKSCALSTVTVPIPLAFLHTPRKFSCSSFTIILPLTDLDHMISVTRWDTLQSLNLEKFFPKFLLNRSVHACAYLIKLAKKNMIRKYLPPKSYLLNVADLLHLGLDDS